MQKRKGNILKNKLYIVIKNNIYIIPIMIGIISFLIIYGITPLEVTNDNWIMAEYDEHDIIQHYAGWLAFRNSDWTIPLGMADQMAVGTGTIISFTDSIPVVAMICKLLRNVLPETFQYFGLFTLLCYILQSIAAYKIINLKTQNKIYSGIGTILFSFAPIFIERAFRHTALGAQWLILFSIYFYLKYREKKEIKTWIWFLILELLAISIHPYFLPMVACFGFLCMMEDLRDKKWISIIFLTGIQIITYFWGYFIGVLGSGISISRDGYGYYSMNINAIVNPSSCGQYTWSAFLKQRTQILGNYDGFNYLGFGIIIFIILTAILIFETRKEKLVLEMIKRNSMLIVICTLLAIFAISNVVTFNDKILFTVPLPEILINICEIFRASSRMFYPVYYMIFVFLLVVFWRLFSEERILFAYGGVIFIIVLQLFDIHSCIIEKHQKMLMNSDYTSYISDKNLANIAENVDSVLMDDCLGNRDTRKLAVWGFKNNMKTYFSVANSGYYNETEGLANELLNQIKNDGVIENYVVVTSNKDVALQYSQFENIGIYKIENMYFVFDNRDVVLDDYLLAATLSDENWTKGVSNDKHVLLFDFSTSVLDQLLGGTSICCNGQIFKIENIDFSDLWIKVTVDSDADVCAYPAELFIQ